MEVISFSKPKLFQLHNGVYSSFELLKDVLKFFLFYIEGPEHSTHVNPVLLNESEKRFGKILDYVFSLRNLENLVFGVIGLLFEFLFRHFRFKKLSLRHFVGAFNFLWQVNLKCILSFSAKVKGVVFLEKVGIHLFVVETRAWERGAVVGWQSSDAFEEMFLIVQKFINEFGLSVNNMNELFSDLMVWLWFLEHLI